MPKPRKRRPLRFSIYRSSGGTPLRLPPGELLLEYFSDADALAWRAKSEDVQRYPAGGEQSSTNIRIRHFLV